MECYCYTACTTAPNFLVVFSNLCRVSQTSRMETICLTNEPLELVQRMPFMLSPSGISLWTDHLFLSYAPSTEGPFMISAYKGSLSVPMSFSVCFLVICLFEWRLQLFLYLQVSSNTNYLVYSTTVSWGSKMVLEGKHSLKGCTPTLYRQTHTENWICSLSN